MIVGDFHSFLFQFSSLYPRIPTNSGRSKGSLPDQSATSPVAPPIHIFHGVFQQFTRDANDYKTPLEPDFLRKVLHFMIDAATFKTSHENLSNSKIRSQLSFILGHHDTSETKPDSTCPDIFKGFNLVLEGSTIRFTEFIGEIKRAHGEGGNEVTVQARSHYSGHQFMAEDDNATWLRQDSQTVLLSSVYDRYCRPLARRSRGGCYRSVHRPTSHMLWIAPCISYEDRYTYQNLVKYPLLFYPTRPHARNFPYPNSYIADDRVQVFRYLKCLQNDPRCVMYQAVLSGGKEPESGDDSGEKLVVKFVETYSEEVHKPLANHSPLSSPYSAEGVIAPATQMQMVDHGKDKPFIDVLKGIVGELHEQGYVLGDIRLPNVIIDTEGEVKLIDFDWTGKDREVCHPISVSSSLFRDVPGVGGLLPTCKHDKAMLEDFLKSP
ncbi:hypothetical protein L218DRAFT_996718 [Marasmius fiardii PR-910]|nr:hypothetical protein L218DRAFT_996718 [Marasmius fiardii PR-910]